MRRGFLLGLATIWLGAAVSVPAGPTIPAQAINEKGRLTGDRKVRYLLRQIDLTEEQARHAEGLIESILSGGAGSGDQLGQVRRLYAEINEAKEAKDDQRMAELSEQLQQLGKDSETGAELFMNLESHLTDEQKQKLERARARLERVPSGAVRPIDLLRAALEHELTEEQQKKLCEGHAGTRKILGRSLRPNVQVKLKMVNFFADWIRELLTPDQVTAFELRLRALRPDLINQGLRAHLPEAVPNEGPPAEKSEDPGD